MCTWNLIICNFILISCYICYCNNNQQIFFVYVVGYSINTVPATILSKRGVLLQQHVSLSKRKTFIKFSLQLQQQQRSFTIYSLYNDRIQVINETESFLPESSSSSSFDDKDKLYYWNETQLISFANDEGIVLSLSKVGPLIRAVARGQQLSSSTAAVVEAVEATYLDSNKDNDKNSNNNESSDSNNIILGYVEGFVRPSSLLLSPTNNILHLDQMIVYQKQIDKIRTNDSKFRNGGTILGVGLLLGYLCILDYVENYSSKNGNKSNLMTEFLAIDDETYQHLRLVKYYTMAGFHKIKYVGNEFNDISDRLIWGGCGTLLRQNCILLLHKWTVLMERSVKRRTKH